MRKSLQLSKIKHEKWLTKMGITKPKLKLARKSTVHKFPDLSVDQKVQTSDRIYADPSKPSAYANRFKETDSVREAIERKAKQVAPAYNKGPIQFIGRGEEKYIGKKI